MNNLHKYECSIQLVQYGKSDYAYEGHINKIPSIVGSGKTYQEALDEIYSNLDAYLDYCKKNSIKYPDPEVEENNTFNVSGRVTIRFPKSLHYALINFAKKDGMSLNSIVIDATREYITRKSFENNIDTIVKPIINKIKSYNSTIENKSNIQNTKRK